MPMSDQRQNSQPSVQVLDAVAEEKQTDLDELNPLYSAIDPDALDALFDSRRTSRTGVGHVTFSYEGYTVTVSSDGRVELSSESP